MKRLGLKWKIVLPVGIALVLGIAAIVGIIARDYAAAMTKAVTQDLEDVSFRYANRVKADMQMSLGGVQSFAAVSQGLPAPTVPIISIC